MESNVKVLRKAYQDGRQTATSFRSFVRIIYGRMNGEQTKQPYQYITCKNKQSKKKFGNKNKTIDKVSVIVRCTQCAI